jgi:hypothetical protein
MPDLVQPSNTDILDAFRMHYRHYEASVHEALVNPTDSTVIGRLGDSLDEFFALVEEVSDQTLGRELLNSHHF